LIDTVNEGIVERRQAMIGREYEILIEGPSKKDPAYSETFSNISVVVKGIYKPGTYLRGRVVSLKGHTPILQPLEGKEAV